MATARAAPTRPTGSDLSGSSSPAGRLPLAAAGKGRKASWAGAEGGDVPRGVRGAGLDGGSDSGTVDSPGRGGHDADRWGDSAPCGVCTPAVVALLGRCGCEPGEGSTTDLRPLTSDRSSNFAFTPTYFRSNILRACTCTCTHRQMHMHVPSDAHAHIAPYLNPYLDPYSIPSPVTNPAWRQGGFEPTERRGTAHSGLTRAGCTSLGSKPSALCPKVRDARRSRC